MLSTLFAWMGGGVASVLHELTVIHAICPEDGGIIELNGPQVSNAKGEHEQKSSQSDLPHAHEHGCTFAGVVAPPTPPPAPWVPVFVDLVEYEVVPYFMTAAGPRAPPLVYAPKTSPPALS